MIYKLRFHEIALTEWQKLDGSVRKPLKNKLAERLENPRVPSAALSGMANCYKIKLKGVGYRLVYRVDDDVLRPPRRRRVNPERARILCGAGVQLAGRGDDQTAEVGAGGAARLL